MSVWTTGQIYALAASTGFADPITATAIAMAESGGNPDAVGDTSITPPYGSVGLWQINVAAHPQYTADSLHDPSTNAQAALAISSGGTNFSPWSTFNSGAYQKYMAAAQAAAGSVPPPQVTQAVQIALILAAGGGLWWLIEHGYLDDALAGAKRLASRARGLLPA